LDQSGRELLLILEPDSQLLPLTAGDYFVDLWLAEQDYCVSSTSIRIEPNGKTSLTSITNGKGAEMTASHCPLPYALLNLGRSLNLPDY
jgi:hypothetical protein